MRRSVRRGGVAFLTVAPVAVWLSSWSVEEARFSPFTLEYQTRQSLVVFTGEVPVYRGEWTSAANEVLTYIAQAHFVEPLQGAGAQWELVYRFKSKHNGGWKRSYQSLRDDRVKWSERHPDVAPMFWKTGFTLVRSDKENEVEAGYELLGSAWEEIETMGDLRSILKFLERLYRIDIMSKAPAALFAVKIDASKSKTSGDENDRDHQSKLGVDLKENSNQTMFDLEDKFLFFPTKFPDGNWKPDGLDFEDVFFTAADGVKLHGWYCPCKDARAVVLHSHGNGGNLAYCASLMKYYQSRLRVASFIFDYRGYGRSDGSPSVTGILKDARAARTWLAKKCGVREERLVLTGQSLGGAVAVDLAADGGARALVLQSTFSSLRDVAAHHYGGLSWLASPKELNSLERIKSYHGLLLMAHGDADDVVPYELGRKLFEAANKPKLIVRIPGGGHNDAITPEFAEKLDTLIANLPR